MVASVLRRFIPARVANTGSQQRDHHANERTFLSWTRAGLGFAAMALALDRLEAIDRVLCSKFNLGPLASSIPAQLEEMAANQRNQGQGQVQNQSQNQNQSSEARSAASQTGQHMSSHLMGGVSPARLCQVLGVWSLGYGFFRYWSMRRYLLVGKFVPAFWGPVFMTCGSFGAFMALGLQVDRKAFLVNI
ncbi:uncharacterized protein N7484_004424 [Penicillium longicatenatum]|uniref:uncharacterized protein n=1 Tax=Penicillium longicatenatum TaxID=1561947 RepID=UPI002548F14B|nr:uncharacterized protein N7484_004424 [Penicillium longicatenatum]KAJ5650701.1 hypothetical protein N7484_004424 [Penicillium longicatenatum]